MRIDINCDVGEGMENEHLIMPLISSCNISCGGHYGDKNTIEETIKLAVKSDLKIGAHPSFPDKENFGRKLMSISNLELKESLQYQIDLFLSILQNYPKKMHHIKPHGALYNAIAKDENLALVFLDSVNKYLDNVFLYVPYNSVIADLSIKKNINIKCEVFADRNYNNDYSLISRSKNNAVITNKNDVLKHVLFMIENEKIKSFKNVELPIKADTFCIHGDTKNAYRILEFLSSELIKKGILLEK